LWTWLFPKKKVIHAPWEKLLDAFMLIVAGGTAMSQFETLIRSDPAVQHAFGRWSSASSSQVQDTLDACTTKTVSDMQQANGQIYHQHSHALHHDFSKELLILDLDLTGLLASKHAEGSQKGYFARQPGKWGRQLCRVIATSYREIVGQTLVPGNTLSQITLKPAIQHAQQRLQLSDEHHHRTLLRWDAGFGTDTNINWMLTNNYHILGKMYAHTRVAKLARSVTHWVPTPSSPGREFGLIPLPHRYARKTRQVMVRTPKKSPGQGWGYGALVTTLSHLTPTELIDLYDDRGGGIETDFRSDRQGLGIGKRRKARMAAQQMLLHLTERAHNLLVWTAQQFGPPLNHYGMLRLIRDALQVNGYLRLSHDQLVEIGLNRYHPLAYALCDGFKKLFSGAPQMTLWDPVDYVKKQ
jgi:hypothetical protein